MDKSPTPTREVLNCLEIQASLGCSRRTVDRLVASGQLTCIQATARGKRMFPRASLEALLAGRGKL
jgi:hypothetical protein